MVKNLSRDFQFMPREFCPKFLKFLEYDEFIILNLLTFTILNLRDCLKIVVGKNHMRKVPYVNAIGNLIHVMY